MPRIRKRKNIASKDISIANQAYEKIKNGKSVRASALEFDLCHVSLGRCIYKKEAVGEELSAFVRMGYRAHNKVFTDEQEKELSKYIIRSADI